jgi:DNA ligase-1
LIKIKCEIYKNEGEIMMDKILEIINQIKNTSSRNEKEFILKQNKDNQLFKTILKFVYDPYIVTGLSTKKINKKIILTNRLNNDFNTIEQVMEYLKTNNTGRDIDVVRMQSFIYKHSRKDVQELLTEIITKSLKMGITATTINKIYGDNYISTFEVMLAEKYFDCENKVSGDFIITEKLDGNRNIAINYENGVKMFTRQGQINEGFVDVEKEFELLPKGYVYDGEFIAVDFIGLNSADLYRETTSKVRKDGIKDNVIFHIFDMLPIEDFMNGICKIPCIDRKNKLHSVINPNFFQWIKETSMLYVGNDKTKVIELLDEYVTNGKEGVMVNIANAPYECKRTKNILKVKKMQSADLRIVGFEEGEGRLKGTLGRMNVEYKGNIVGVGSGFTDATRNHIWNNRDEFIGKIAEIQYFEESSNAKTKEVSLRFPVMKCIREDKTEPSYF